MPPHERASPRHGDWRDYPPPRIEIIERLERIEEILRRMEERA